MNIYRDDKTGRLVRLYNVSPRMVSGSWFETEDLFTEVRKRITNLDSLTLVAER